MISERISVIESRGGYDKSRSQLGSRDRRPEASSYNVFASEGRRASKRGAGAALVGTDYILNVSTHRFSPSPTAPSWNSPDEGRGGRVVPGTLELLW